MILCPKCKYKCSDDEKVCPNCGENLKKTVQADEKEAFLISVNEGFNANLVEGGLRTAGIPFIKKGHGGPAGFFRYDTKYESLGVDFYVPSELLSRAKDALPPVDGVVTEKESGEDSSQSPGNNGKLPDKIRAASPAQQIIGIVLLIAAVCIVIFGVDTIMNIIRKMMGY